MVSIKQQLNDKRNYIILKENVEQKILNSDSLKAENIKFGNWQNKKVDSLRKINISKAMEYIRREKPVEFYNYKKKSTPIIYFHKPIFLKDKNKIIFSYYFYSGEMNALKETALYEFRNGKWFKLKIIYLTVS